MVIGKTELKCEGVIGRFRLVPGAKTRYRRSSLGSAARSPVLHEEGKDQFLPLAHSEPLKQPADVGAHRGHTDTQFRGDLLVAKPGQDQVGYLFLPLGKRQAARQLLPLGQREDRTARLI